MRDCKATRVEIEEASGALPLGGAAREHVAACAACKEFYAERASLRRLVGDLERVSAPDDFDRRLRARMASAGASKRNGRPALFRLAFVPVAAAACLLVVAAGSLYVWQQRKTTPAVATQAGGDGGRARPVQVAESREGEGAASSARDDEGGADSNDAAPADADNNSGRGQKTVRGARRARAFEPARRASTTDVRSEGGGFEFTQHGASVIAGPGRTGQRAASATALRIPLRASAEPLEVLFRDERGALQRVPMRSVSFGSQEPVAGVRAKAVPASLKSREGVW